MPRWTADQQEAIISRNSNLLVSAAAGSGKTAVLVERIIQLIIESHVGIDEMLIVTFTNAAASEMRERIVAALYDQLEKEDNPFLREQVNKIQRASIMTLHAFCISVLRNNAHVIGIDPGFKVGDTVELNIMAAEAMEAILEDAYEKASDSFHHFVEAYSENRQDKRIEQLIYDTYSFIQSQPQPIKWLNDTVDVLMQPDTYIDLLKENIKFDLKSAMEILEAAAVLTSEPDGPLEYDEMIQSDIGHLVFLEEKLSDLNSFVDAIRNIKHMRLKSISKDRKEEVSVHHIEEVKALRKQYKAIVDDVKDFFEHKSVDDYIEDVKAVEPLMRELAHLVNKYNQAFTFDKLDKNMVDFNDLEHLALDALLSEDVQNYYRKKFKYIFLDEYQDSNLVQETLIERIKRENNVFLVGDVKQSIYKFRLADPTIFMDKYHRYSKETGTLNRRIDLKKNFRSRRDILEGINFIFESLMSESFGEMEYDQDARLYTGIEFGDIPDSSIEVQIVEGNYQGDELLEILNTAEVEAKSIAKTIKSLVGTPSYDRKNDVFFDLKYKDMVILMRAVSSWAPVFNDVFLKEGIPLFADAGGGYFDATEIKMFVDLLRLIDNKAQDLPLLTVLRSPIFDFEIEDLIKIRIESQSKFYHQAFFKHEGDYKARINQVVLDLSRWKKQSRYMRLDELLWQIMMETGYYQYVGAMPGGKARQGNLRLLVDRAEQMEKNQNTSLHQFVATVDKMHKTNSELGTAKIIGESENVVRIMSIHKSKGLEFPLVIVAGMGKKFNLRDAYQSVLMHKNLGLGPKFVDPIHRVGFDTLPKKLIKRQIKMESLAEEMRVLYVALTRAVDKLILIGTVKNLESQSKKWTRGDQIYNLLSAQSYMDWLMMILSKHPSSQEIWSLADKHYLGLKAHETKWTIKLIHRESLYDSLDENTNHLRDVLLNLRNYEDEHVNKTLDELFSSTYNYKLHELPSKFSVTELKQLESGAEKFIEPLSKEPKFLAKAKGKSPAEVGTLTHFIMQKLDRHNHDIQGQIEHLMQKNVLQSEDMKYIDISRFEIFFDSELGKRYQASDKVFKEKAFVLKKKIEEAGQDDILIQGIVDCYFEEGDDIVLIDYKTDYLYGDETKLVDKYRVQLDLYKEAIEKITGKKVKQTYIYSFFKGKSIEIAY